MSKVEVHCLRGWGFQLLSAPREAAGDCIKGYNIKRKKQTPPPPKKPNPQNQKTNHQKPLLFPQAPRETLHITAIASKVLSMLIVMNTAFFSFVFLLPLYVFAFPVCSLTH